jgi:tRNA uridine 5-carboxymethylaminomethyl modification enzyme
MMARLDAVRDALALADRTSMTPEVADPVLIAAGSRPLQHAVRAVELTKRQDISLQSLFDAAGVGADLPRDAVIGAELEIKYAGYFDKERSRAARLTAQGAITLPASLDYDGIRTISIEARQKLGRLRPETLAQASAIPGISPADLQNLMWEVRRRGASIYKRVGGELSLPMTETTGIILALYWRLSSHSPNDGDGMGFHQVELPSPDP